MSWLDVAHWVGPQADAAPLTRRALLVRASVAAGGAVSVGAFGGGQASATTWPAASAYSGEVPAAWFDLALDLVRTTPGFSPPVASRAFGYAGVALYQAVVPGIPRCRSFAGELNGLAEPPRPARLAYHWPTVASSALASILPSLFPTTPAVNRAAIEELDRRFSTDARATLPPVVYRRSVKLGADVARHVFEWSKLDGGHEAFLRNFPPFTPPSGPGLWEPTPPGYLPALQPYWGTIRPFVLRSGETCSPAPPPAYSENPGSPFYREAHECYASVNRLTPDQEAIARFWSDDPGETATAPGHSISILTQVVRALDLPLGSAAEAYAKVGVAVADAFISCWSTKYRFNLLRPVTYIRRLIDPNWTPLLITPPFPEYTSGHSVQSGAAAQVLTDLFGPLTFTDRTHERTGLAPRSFGSFIEAAHEAAISRLYGGIHFRAACERGVEQGICVGKRVSALPGHGPRLGHL
jgi:PAP2 superfamily